MHVSEYEVETKFIDRLESIGYEYIDLKNYDDVIDNFKSQLIKFNEKKIKEAKGTATLSDAEFSRVLIHLDNRSVYESAKALRDKYVLSLDNGKTVYLDFFSFDTDRNIYQVSHQITMDKDHKDDVSYKNRYDVTVLINGLPLVQIELKRPGVEINEAINQINRYRKFSFKGLFRYLQLFVVSNSVQTKYFCNENEMDNGLYNPILKSLVFFWTDEKNKRINTLEEFTAEFFRRSAITEMIDKFMVIKTTEPVLMVRPHAADQCNHRDHRRKRDHRSLTPLPGIPLRFVLSRAIIARIPFRHVVPFKKIRNKQRLSRMNLHFYMPESHLIPSYRLSSGYQRSFDKLGVDI